jgi:hypothetical protein
MTSRTIMRGLLVGGALCVSFSLPAAGQVKSTETVEHGTGTHQVTIERGEIVYVSGNDVVVKMEDGSLRDFNNVPDSVTVNVGGQQLNVHQLKPGMKVERQTITTTTPRVITKVETVTGKVWHVVPPNSVILTLEDGTNQSFKIPKGQKFTVDGQVTDAFGLKKGMMVSAQRVTEVPETVVTQQVKADWNNAAASAGTQAGCADPDRYGGANTSASRRRSQGRTSTQKIAEDRQHTAAHRRAWCTVLRVGVDGHGNPKVRCLIH